MRLTVAGPHLTMILRLQSMLSAAYDRPLLNLDELDAGLSDDNLGLILLRRWWQGSGLRSSGWSEWASINFGQNGRNFRSINL
jgi:hypothetical protein